MAQTKMGMIEKLSGAFGALMPSIVDDVLGTLPKGAIALRPVETTNIPCYERIAAGNPIEMCEIIEDIEAPLAKRKQYPYSYFLIATSDSLNKEVLDGSYVLIDPKAEVHSGDTVAVNINGYDATLKVWHKISNSVILFSNSANQEHKGHYDRLNRPRRAVPACAR